MNKKETMALRPGDTIRAANGQVGTVFLHLHEQKKLIIKWDNGEHKTYTRAYGKAWMIEQLSCAVVRS